MATSDASKFRTRLAQSKRAVSAVSFMLLSHGYQGKVNEGSIKAVVPGSKFYDDGGDITLTRAGIDYRIEVKNRSFNFTGIDDYPFPTIFIMALETWLLTSPKPDVLFITSKDLKHCCYIKGSLSWWWWWQSVRDNHYTHHDPYYILVTSKELCHWASTEEIMKHGISFLPKDSDVDPFPSYPHILRTDEVAKDFIWHHPRYQELKELSDELSKLNSYQTGRSSNETKGHSLHRNPK